MTASPHPPVDDLAAYAAGDLDHDPAARVSRHLAACAACSADVEAIERTSRTLAALPALSMPVDVIGRVEQAIEAERQAAARTRVGPVTALPPRRGGGTRVLPFAAAAAVVGIAAVVGLGSLRGADRGENENAARSGGDVAALSDAAAPVVLQSGTDYTEAQLDDQVRRVLDPAAPAAPLADSAAGAGTAAEGAPAPAAETMAQLRVDELDSGLRSCVTELAGSPDTAPLVVDIATYGGQPAWVVVLPFRDARVDVFVVRRDCRVGNDALLLFKRVTRG